MARYITQVRSWSVVHHRRHFIVVVTMMDISDQFPVFFISGTGSTLVRQVVLALSGILLDRRLFIVRLEVSEDKVLYPVLVLARSCSVRHLPDRHSLYSEDRGHRELERKNWIFISREYISS